MTISPINQSPSPLSRRKFLRTCLFSGAAAFVGRLAWSGVFPSVPHTMMPESHTSQLKIIPRSRWSKFVPEFSRLKSAGHYSRITIHHEGNKINTHTQWNAVVDDLNGILKFHLGSHKYYTNYHFIIDYAGRIWTGRSVAYEGAHVSGQNIENLGIMLLGNFEYQFPSMGQLSSLFSMIKLLQSQYKIASASIYGHRDLGLTLCPGKHLYDPFVSELRTLSESTAEDTTPRIDRTHTAV